MSTGASLEEPLFQDDIGPGDIPEEFKKEEE